MMDDFEKFLREFSGKMLSQKNFWNDIKKDTWKDCDMSYLRKELKRQFEQIYEAEHIVPNRHMIMHELVDLANMAAMLYGRYNEMTF